MKRYTAKRIISALSAVLLALPAAGCGGDTSDTPSQTPDTTAQAIEAAETDIYDTLKTKDYGGRVFRVLTNYSNYAITDFDYESLSGELIEDTIYNRDRAVEEKLNIKIENTKSPEDYNYVQSELKKTVNSGDDLYDIMFSEAGISAASAADGYMLDLREIPDMDLSKPWWEQEANRWYEMNGRLFFTHSPMQLHYYESLIAIFFSKKIASDIGAPDMYGAADSGTWTYDALLSASQSANRDADGDGTISADQDMIGTAISSTLMCYLPLSAGCRFTESENGSFVWKGVSEKLNSFTDKLKAFYQTTDNYVSYSTPGVKKLTGGYIGAFTQDHSLFLIDVLGTTRDLRSMESDYGILPLPKYDESQKDYISSAYNGSAILFVPVVNAGASDIGPILDMLGAYSYRDLKPAYYEININAKSARDEDSIRMMEIMTSNITFDMGLVCSLGDMNAAYQNTVLKNTDLLSDFAKIEPKITSAIEKLVG